MAKQRKKKVADAPVVFCRTSLDVHQWISPAADRAELSQSLFVHRLLDALRELDDEAHRDHDGAPLTAEYFGLRLVTALRGLIAIHPAIDRDVFERLVASGDYPPDVVDRLMGRKPGSERK